MNAAALAAIRARLEAATPGGPVTAHYGHTAAESTLVAHAPRDLAALLDEVDRLTERLTEYENAINWQIDCLNCSRLLDECYAETARAERAEVEVDRLAKQLEAVREAWEPYADDDMAPVPWRLQRDMNAALGEA